MFSNNLPLALLAEWPGSFMYYCGVTVGCEDGGGGERGWGGGGERIQIVRVSAETAAPTGTQTRGLSMASPVLLPLSSLRLSCH